jgi:hypothetical protein
MRTAPGSALNALRRALTDMPSGPIAGPAKAQIEGLLADAWHGLKGAGAEGMTVGKLRGRTEELTWQPPDLSFVIERHGATVLGSTRGELHRWDINVETGEAACRPGGYRQLSPRASAVKVQPLVEEVVRAVLRHEEHPAVTWLTPTRVRVTPSQVEVLRSGFKQTAEGRRKRFIAALEQELKPRGWSRVPVGNRFVYELSAD